MNPQEAMGQAELQYLQTIYYLAGGKAKVAVSVREVQEEQAGDEEEASRCSDFWTKCGVLEWPALGHVALTHLGLAQAEFLAAADGVEGTAPALPVAVPTADQPSDIISSRRQPAHRTRAPLGVRPSMAAAGLSSKVR